MEFALFISTMLASSAYLDEGRAAVGQVRFEDARRALLLAKSTSTLTQTERREVYVLLAYCAAAEGKLPEAEQVYAELLADDARAPAPTEGPPRLREAFRRVKERLYPPGVVQLKREPAPRGRLTFQVIDPWQQSSSIVLRFGSTTQPVEVDGDGRGAATLPPGVEWSLEVKEASGAVLATLSGQEPAELVVAPPVVAVRAQRPRWVPWAVGGVAAVGAVTTAIFAGLGANALQQANTASFAADLRSNELLARQHFSWAWGVGVGSAVAALASAVLFFVW